MIGAKTTRRLLRGVRRLVTSTSVELVEYKLEHLMEPYYTPGNYSVSHYCQIGDVLTSTAVICYIKRNSELTQVFVTLRVR